MISNNSISPRLTIGLPVYNGERFLAAAIESLCKQTYRPFVLVVSDNASTDGTEQIVRSAAALDSRIVYRRAATNRGPIWNFNRCLEWADTEYFKWAAADDVCAPEFLETCINYLDSHADVVCCHCETRLLSAHGEVLWHLPSPNFPPLDFPRDDAPLNASSSVPSRRFRDVLLSSGWGVRSYGVIRTAALARTNRLASVFGSEKVLMAELALQGKFHDIAAPLFFQRVHDDSWSQSKATTNGANKPSSLLERRPRVPLRDRLKLLGGYFKALVHTQQNASTRLRCFLHLGEYLFQWRKWRNLFRS